MTVTEHKETHVKTFLGHNIDEWFELKSAIDCFCNGSIPDAVKALEDNPAWWTELVGRNKILEARVRRAITVLTEKITI